MALSIPEAWIAAYLVNVGETYGCSLAAVPLHGKKKARYTQTLSYEDSAESHVWVKVSDHVHEIPARFTKAAILEYNKLFSDDPIVTKTGAIITIGNFKPMFSRVPIGNNVKRLTREPRLALEIGYVRIVGSAGEDAPSVQDVETDPKLEAWTRGLREDGDGGNVLKRMKDGRGQESSKVSKQPSPRKILPPPPACLRKPTNSPRSKASHSKDQVGTNGHQPRQPSKKGASARPKADTAHHSTRLKKQRQKWQDHLTYGFEIERPAYFKDLLSQIILPDDEDLDSTRMKTSYSRLPSPIEGSVTPLDNSSGLQSPGLAHSTSPRCHALNLGSDSLPQTPDSAASRTSFSEKPTTPSHWSPSVRGSPKLESDIGEDEVALITSKLTRKMSVLDEDDNSYHESRHSLQIADGVSPNHGEETRAEASFRLATLSNIAAPTPAQRPNPNARRKSKSISPPISSLLHPPSSVISIPSNNHPSFETAGAAQSPMESQEVVYSARVKRKVPYPDFRPPLPDPDKSRILVPDSDTSARGSQPLSQSVLASQSQGYSHPRPSFQPAETTSQRFRSSREIDQVTEDPLSSPECMSKAESQRSGDNDHPFGKEEPDVGQAPHGDDVTEDMSHKAPPSSSLDYEESDDDGDDAETEALLTGLPRPEPKFARDGKSEPAYEQDDLSSMKAKTDWSRSALTHQNDAISEHSGKIWPVYEQDDVFLLSTKASSNSSPSTRNRDEAAVPERVGKSGPVYEQDDVFPISKKTCSDLALDHRKAAVSGHVGDTAPLFRQRAAPELPITADRRGEKLLQHNSAAWRQPSFMRHASEKANPRALPAERKSRRSDEPDKFSSHAVPTNQAVPKAPTRAAHRVQPDHPLNQVTPPTSPTPERAVSAPIAKRLDLTKTSNGKRSRERISTGSLADSSNRKRRKVSETGAKKDEVRDGRHRHYAAHKVKDEPAEVELDPAKLLKLKGYRLDFGAAARSRAGLPPPMSEENVKDCLLAIGRARHKSDKRHL